MDERLELIESALDRVLPRATERPETLSAAMRWAVEGGGKRIRPQICLAAAEAVGGTAEDALMPACAVELLHSYTLIHDDLPAMDNDAERRGKASVWAKFGEANAILAGDALQALAFATAARSPRNVAAIVAELGRRGVGVVQGQIEDLVVQSSRFKVPGSEFKVPGSRFQGTERESSFEPGTRNLDPETLNFEPGTLSYVYEHKTADLFMAAACMGALAGGGTSEQVEKLRVFALNLGFAFQYEDDLLDDDSPVSREETERRVRDYTAKAVAALEGLPGPVEFLTRLANRLVSRKN